MSKADLVSVYLSAASIPTLSIVGGGEHRVYELSHEQLAELGCGATHALLDVIDNEKKMKPTLRPLPWPDANDGNAPLMPPPGTDPLFHLGGLIWNDLIKQAGQDASLLKDNNGDDMPDLYRDAFLKFKTWREKHLMSQGLDPYRMEPRPAVDAAAKAAILPAERFLTVEEAQKVLHQGR